MNKLILPHCPQCGKEDRPLTPCSKCGKRVCVDCITVVTEFCPAFIDADPLLTSRLEGAITVSTGEILGEIKRYCRNCIPGDYGIFQCSNCKLIHIDPETIDGFGSNLKEVLLLGEQQEGEQKT